MRHLRHGVQLRFERAVRLRVRHFGLLEEVNGRRELRERGAGDRSAGGRTRDGQMRRAAGTIRQSARRGQGDTGARAGAGSDPPLPPRRTVSKDGVRPRRRQAPAGQRLDGHRHGVRETVVYHIGSHSGDREPREERLRQRARRAVVRGPENGVRDVRSRISVRGR